MDARRESGYGRQERPFMNRVSEVSHGRPAGIRVRVSGEVFHERNICGKIGDIMENEVR